MSSKPRLEFIGLELDIAGCPNTCRHCKDGGRRPCGELMSFDDAKWVVEQFRGLTTCEQPVVGAMEACLYHEPTAHPDFLSLLEYFADAELLGDPEDSIAVLATNGYGIAHADDCHQMLGRLKKIGTRMVSSTLHGLEEHHDWFVCRKGAFRDIFLAAERAADAGLKVFLNVYLDRRNTEDLSRLLYSIHSFENRMGSEVGLSLSVPSSVVGKRLRVYESKLRPSLSDLEMLPAGLEAFWEPPYDRYTESSWIERILTQPTDPSLESGFDPEVSDGEGSFILAVDRFFDVHQRPYNFNWPAVKHGNLRTDDLPAILDSMEAWRPPQLPDLTTLAERYGDRNSTLIHKNAFSIRNKWLDIYWRDERTEF